MKSQIIYDVVLIHGTIADENLNFLAIAKNKKQAISKVREFVNSQSFNVKSPREYSADIANFTPNGVLHI